jgi:hypothetical protein
MDHIVYLITAVSQVFFRLHSGIALNLETVEQQQAGQDDATQYRFGLVLLLEYDGSVPESRLCFINESSARVTI